MMIGRSMHGCGMCATKQHVQEGLAKAAEVFQQGRQQGIDDLATSVEQVSTVPSSLGDEMRQNKKRLLQEAGAYDVHIQVLALCKTANAGSEHLSPIMVLFNMHRCRLPLTRSFRT